VSLTQSMWSLSASARRQSSGLVFEHLARLVQLEGQPGPNAPNDQGNPVGSGDRLHLVASLVRVIGHRSHSPNIWGVRAGNACYSLVLLCAMVGHLTQIVNRPQTSAVRRVTSQVRACRRCTPGQPSLPSVPLPGRG
jgi:hypothetical protein